MSKQPPMDAVVIGASAGAFDALSAILPLLPGDFPAPVMVVVHVPPDKKSIIAELFQERCQVRVCEAEDKMPILPGTVYFAPPDYHLQVEDDHILSLSNDEPLLFSRPSIDVLFETAADAYGDGLVGVVLSGANQDGTEGLQAILAAGGVGLVQRPDLARASIMPKSALDHCPGAQAMTLEQIAAYLQKAGTP